MNIIIAGGGTAGWLAAFAIKRLHLSIHNITLIESPDIGIIGAGEGSTGIFLDYLMGKWFPTNLNLPDFVSKTEATPKYGIKHVNWKGDGSHYIAPIDSSPSAAQHPDRLLITQCLLDRQNFHHSSYLGFCIDHKITFPLGSFHFDAFKVGEYFKNILVNEDSVKYIQGKIIGVNQEDNLIKKITLDNGQDIEGDFFIDCTGFAKVLMKSLAAEYIEYSEHLPVNSALGFQIPLDDQVSPYTTAHAMNAGWIWKIPTQTRYGCGYVYSNNFITKDQAHDEIVKHYGDVKILREFKFVSGRQKRVWIGNCLALGLAAAFSEPLEATSIHTTIAQIISFIHEYLKPSQANTVIDSRIKTYNDHTARMYDDIKDFLNLHYMGGRTDTEFWKSIKPTEHTKYILEIVKHNVIPTPFTFSSYYEGQVGSSLYNWILLGLGKISQESLLENAVLIRDIEETILEIKNLQKNWMPPCCQPNNL